MKQSLWRTAKQHVLLTLENQHKKYTLSPEEKCLCIYEIAIQVSDNFSSPRGHTPLSPRNKCYFLNSPMIKQVILIFHKFKARSRSELFLLSVSLYVNSNYSQFLLRTFSVSALFKHLIYMHEVDTTVPILQMRKPRLRLCSLPTAVKPQTGKCSCTQLGVHIYLEVHKESLTGFLKSHLS